MSWPICSEGSVMSRTIPMGNPDLWTDDDIVYLRDRGKLPANFDLPVELMAVAPEAISLDELPYLGDIGTIKDPAPDDDGGGNTGGFVEDDDFESMTKSQLVAEARARDISDQGNRSAMIERIQAHDSRG